jgi:serine protease Do
VVLRFDGEVIDDTRELVRVVAESEIGRTVEIVVFRDGAEQTLEVEIGLLEEATLAAAPGPQGEAAPPPEQTVLGMTVAAIDRLLRERFALPDDVRGLVVVEIDDDSDAFLKGMRPGDVIAEVGQEEVASPEDMRDRIEAAEQAGRNSILMLVRRDGQPRFVALNLSN